MACEARHEAQTITEGLHSAISFEYANESARLAGGPFESFDKNKLALQTDDDSLWLLVDEVAETWIQINQSATTILNDNDGYILSISDSTNDAGIIDLAARADHQHAHGDRGGGSLHELATSLQAGFFSSDGYIKLDGIEDGAQVNAVDSVFGRTGAVIALSGDYDSDLIDNASTVPGASVSDALEYLDGYVNDGVVGGDLSGTLPNPQVVDLTISGEQQGSILYFDGSNWVQLPPGTDGYVLTTQGVGDDPEWTSVASVGAGDVIGPASSTDEALVRWDGTSGKFIQNSNATLTDAGALTLTLGLTTGGDIDVGGNSITNVNLVDGVDVSAHASRHEFGGADTIEISNLSTSETDTTLVLKPDGAGSVSWVVDQVRDLDGYVFEDRQVIAGAGLVGGGDLSADRTFDVVANADGSIVVNANDIQVGTLANDAQHGDLGGGSLHELADSTQNGFFSIDGYNKLEGIEAGAQVNTVDSVFGRTGAVIALASDYDASQIDNDSTVPGAFVDDALDNLAQDIADIITDLDGYVPDTRVLTAGAGLTGGGDLSADRIFDVVANADGSIVVNANDIQVGTLANDAQHGDLGGGSLHELADGTQAGFFSIDGYNKLEGIEDGAQVNTVDSVFGRTGAVVALASDYDASQIDNDSTVPGVFVDDALDYLDGYISSVATDFESHADRHEFGGADQIDGYELELTYSPSNYLTPVNNKLGEHIAAIDDALAGAAFGDVVGPASSTDNAIVRFDGTTGKLIQNSGVTIDDSGNLDMNSNEIQNPSFIDFSGGTAVTGFIRWASSGFTLRLLDVAGKSIVAFDSGVADEVFLGSTSNQTTEVRASSDVELSAGGSLTAVFDTDTATSLAAAGDGYVLTWNATTASIEYVDPSVVGVTDHGDLAGLGDDDHTQYLLVDGTRAMSGDLDMGGNSITNVNLVDGVDVSDHSARHDPGGADALTTAAAVAISVGDAAAEGTALSFARSDHLHTVTAGTPVAVGNANATGSSGNFVHSDHVHQLGGTVGGDLSGTLPNPTVTDLTITGEQQGSVLYFDGSNWVQLPPGTDGYALLTQGTGANPEWGEVAATSKRYAYVQFILGEDINNTTRYFTTWRNHGGDSAGSKRSGTFTSLGIQNQNSCSPYQVPFDATIIKAIMKLKGAGVQNGSVTYPVTYQTDLFDIGFNSETKIADIDFSISSSFTVGTFSVGNTNYTGSVDLDIDVDEAQLLGLEFINGIGASLVGQTRNAFITLILEER